MVEPLAVLTSLVGSVAAGIFLSVALRLQRHPGSEPARHAMQLFAMWWFALAVNAVVSAAMDLLGAFGVAAFGPFVALDYVRVFALCIGLWGLMYYLAYVLTGKRALLAPLAVLFALYYGAIVFIVTVGRPVAVDFARASARLLYENPLLDRAATGALLVAPPLVAAGTYLFLYFRVDSRTHRYRTAILAIATAVWCAGLLVREADLVAMLPAALAFASAFAVNWAYAPPKFVARRLAADA